MPRISIRNDLGALEGYHSPQVSVRMRMNTNEAPSAPPDAWRKAYAAEIATIDWHRYPDRAATALRSKLAEHHGVGIDNVFAANGSNEVLLAVLLTFGGAGRTVATFEPTYQLHGHLARISGATTVEGTRNADFTLDPAEITRVCAEYSPDVTFLCSPNNPTGLVEPRQAIDTLIANAPGLIVVDEAYGQFADWSAEELLDEELPLVVTHTFSKTWSMAAVRLGYLIGPTWLIAELDKVVLPYHLDTAKQIAGRLALDFVGEMNARVDAIVAGRAMIETALRHLDVDYWPSGANFILFRPRAIDAKAVWQRPVRSQHPGARLQQLATLAGLPAGHRRHSPRRTRPSVPR